jgi:DNA-binding CsgD family transcriptional regulator
MPTALRAAESALDALERLADAGLPAQDFMEQSMERVERVVPTDGHFVSATDPETAYATGAATVRSLPSTWCRPTWDYEFLVPDVLKYADISRSGRAVADIHEATSGRPDRSPRFRHFSADTGYRAELRLAFVSGWATYGIGQLNRAGASRFCDAEKDWLERAAVPIARGLRRALLDPPTERPAERGPGVILVDRHGEVVSTTPAASEWLNELDAELLSSGDSLPFYGHALALLVRAAYEDGVPVPRARLRTSRGVWLLLHGAPLAGTDQVALIIEPAKSSDVAPMIVEAYGLSARELDVARTVARGLGTGEVAEHLHLSPHTVRDHLKALFEKVGVSSRGQLVHKLFAEHYATAH